MKLLTDDGYTPATRSRWPLAGLDGSRSLTLGAESVPLVDTVNGRMRRASYADLYRTNPYINAAVTRNSMSLARFSLKVYEFTDTDGNRRRVRGDTPKEGAGAPRAAERLDSLIRRPNPSTSGVRLRLSAYADAEIYGNALIEKGRGSSERIDALWHVPWERVSVIVGDDEPIVGYEIVGKTGRKRTLSPDDVIHLKLGADPDSPLGLSPLEPLARSSGLMDAIQRFLLAYFRNQARPSGNLKLPPGADSAILQFVKDEIMEIYSTPENAGQPMVTTGDWQSISAEPAHSEALGIYKLSREEVSAVTGVPGPLLGVLDKATLSNVEALKNYYVTDVLGPKAEMYEGDYDQQLLAPSFGWDRLFVEHDLNTSLRPDLKSRSEAYRSMRYVLTTNELRSMENLPPIDDSRADTVWLPGAEIPLIPETQVLHEPQEPPAPGEGGEGPGGDPADEADGGGTDEPDDD